MDKNLDNFIQRNSPDGGFLQSPEWRKFQEAAGRKTYNISGDGFWTNIIEHALPVVGKYFYAPRGPIMSCNMKHETCNKNIEALITLAKKNKSGWIRIEPNDIETLGEIKKSVKCRITKAPHDVQPKELFIIDITKPEEQLLAEMKSKTRYNIKVAQKRGVQVSVITNNQDTRDKPILSSNDQNSKLLSRFVELTGVMAKRNGIVSHEGNYYKKMFETIPSDILKLYIAEYEGKIICANLVIFYGKACTYLHGASDDRYRNVMAPYLLQWQQILDAKAAGCEKYDFGGVKVNFNSGRSWAGVTRFKLGFSPNTKPTVFPGCCDIIINPLRYWGYRGIQRAKSLVRYR